MARQFRIQLRDARNSWARGPGIPEAQSRSCWLTASTSVGASGLICCIHNAVTLPPTVRLLMTLQIGDPAPDFTLPDENGTPITLSSLKGQRVVIYFYPKDFTFICPTEIAEFGRLNKEFADRDAVVMGGSSDNEFCKLAWRRDHRGPPLEGRRLLEA